MFGGLEHQIFSRSMKRLAKPKCLYVIGNGFDLWHDIPSKFSDFKSYVSKNAPEVFEEVETYLPAGDEWNQLEQALAEMDVDALIDNLGHFMASYGADDWSDSGHHDFQYEVDNCVERLSTGLKHQFANWVRGLPIPNHLELGRRLTTLDPAAYYLTFNYTPTLKSVYGIDSRRVCFIHGNAAVQDEELILGHAWSPTVRPSLNSREDVEEMDVRMYEANEIIDSYFSSTFKRSAELIQKHAYFFDQLSDVEQVVILGHSLSEVDSEYFAALLEVPALKAANWMVACRSLSAWTDKLIDLQRLGIPTQRATAVIWDSL
ncbi:MAG: bacteriophage abortive infection AbiH family protein [Diaphorobacter nitroreducens]